MSCFRAAALVLFGSLALGACGFTPAYLPPKEGGSDAAQALYGRIEVAAPQDSNGFLLAARLEDRLGRGGARADYDLTTALSVSTDTLTAGGVSANSAVRRYMRGRVTWALIERASGDRIAGGSAEGFTAYSVTASHAASQSAADDAASRLMRNLADQVSGQILARAGRLP